MAFTKAREAALCPGREATSPPISRPTSNDAAAVVSSPASAFYESATSSVPGHREAVEMRHSLEYIPEFVLGMWAPLQGKFESTSKTTTRRI